MLIMPSCKKSLIVEQFQGNYLHSIYGANCRHDLFTQLMWECHVRFSLTFTPSDFTGDTCSTGTLLMESSSVSDKVLNLRLESIIINSVFVAFKVSLLDTSHFCLVFQGLEID